MNNVVIKIFEYNDIQEEIKKAEKSNVMPYFILESDGELHNYIEAKCISDDILLKLKLAKEINFSKYKGLRGVYVQGYSERYSTLGDLLSFLFKLDTYPVIVIDTDKSSGDEYEILSELIQQLIYLGLNIDVRLKSELEDIARYERYQMSIKQFEEEINILSQKLDQFKSDDAKRLDFVEEEKRKITAKVGEIKQLINESKQRNLEIAVMATKKTGKSVIVNSLLDNEYAPTSLELPTPNACVYEATDLIDNKIRLYLDYDNKDNWEEFDSPLECKKKIYNIFNEAKNAEGSKKTIPNMRIQYPRTQRAFTVIDTPGPDRAGTPDANSTGKSHKDVAHEWIKKADAIIFAIDYSKHLQESEVDFLQEIKSVLWGAGKFHSLILAVNKLDLKYTSTEQKSVVRVLSYIRSELKKLGLNSVYIFGISSLQYFTAHKLQELDGFNDVPKLSPEDFFNFINKKSREQDISSESKTIITTVKTNMNMLIDFHGIDVDLGKILETSGMPYFIKFVSYVATQKANYEKFKNLFGETDRIFASLKTYFDNKNLDGLKAQEQEIKAQICNIVDFIKRSQKEAFGKAESGFDDCKKKLEGLITDFFVKTVEPATIEKLKIDFSTVKQSVLAQPELLKRKDYIKNMTKFDSTYLKGDISNASKEAHEMFNKAIGETEANINNVMLDIKSEIKKFNEAFSYKICISDMEYSLDKTNFSADFSENLDMGYPEGWEEHTEKKKKQKNSKIFLLGQIIDFFKPEYESYTVLKDPAKFEEALSELEEKVLENIREKFNEIRNNKIQSVNEVIDKIKYKTESELGRAIIGLYDIKGEITTNLNSDKDELRLKIDLLEYATSEFDILKHRWNNIKNGDDAK